MKILFESWRKYLTEDLRQGNIGLDMKTHSLKILDGSVFNTSKGERGQEIRALGS